MEIERKIFMQSMYPAFDTVHVRQKYSDAVFNVVQHDDTVQLFDVSRVYKTLAWASIGHESAVSIDRIATEAIRNMYDGISFMEVTEALILSSIAFIEKDPAYGYVAAQLLLKKLFYEVTGESIERCELDVVYQKAFIHGIKSGVEKGIFDERLLTFDLEYLARHIVPDRDHLFFFMGIKTLYERYFIKQNNIRYELPQSFWLRIAMGLAVEEQNKNERAIEFYTVMSQMRYVPSTPTLLHSGLTRPQLSSCFLTTVEDDLHHIFKCIGDNAQLAKWSGGVANDWTNIRSTGAMIKSINTESQGVIPFLKVANDTTASINRSGKRRGASVVYLETWHLDIEDFLDLRKNTGDERRRTHDINTANWIPDLFMKRVMNDEQWTLFSPHEVPDLHHLYGKAFEERYVHYERMAAAGNIKMTKQIGAKQLWRKMLSRLFETGHPWITFKDAFNVRSTQDHVGVIHSTNLCTEISLNTSAEETAVCNLGSVNLARHIVDNKINDEMLADTIHVAMRMLDNVIDINFYPVKEAQTANLRHRPVGLGIMGFQDVLFELDLSFSDQETLAFTDTLMEKVAYHAIYASSLLAKERGTYSSYKGSKWDRNIFPQDTIALLEQERGIAVTTKKTESLDWTPVRDHVKKYGMRNSNTMAIAPTATISNIADCFPCIEPIYKNLYVKANMSGEFTVINKYLVEDLKKLNLWDKDMIDELKYYDGNVQMINRIPQHIKDKYYEAFDIDAEWMIELSAVRGRWLDQSQSHNVFMRGVSGKKLHDIYTKAWNSGMKSTYYLRTLGASQIEKSTLDDARFGFTQKREYVQVDNTALQKVAEQLDVQQVETVTQDIQDKAVMCSILNGPDCESCQ